MSAFSIWLRSLLPPRRSAQGGENGSLSTTAHDLPARSRAAEDLIERARALAREGREQEASGIYWRIKRKHWTVDGLVEHAELLLRLGDHFGAVAKAAQALQLEPESARARAIQARIRTSEEPPRGSDRSSADRAGRGHVPRRDDPRGSDRSS